MDRILASCFLGRSGGCSANWELISTPTIALLDNICFQGERADYTMELKEKTTCVTERMAFWVPSP